MKFADLKDTDLVQVLNMDDYFSNNRPYIEKVLTKQEFCNTYLDGGECTFEEYMTGSGDGGDNYVLLIIDPSGKIDTVLP